MSRILKMFTFLTVLMLAVFSGYGKSYAATVSDGDALSSEEISPVDVTDPEAIVTNAWGYVMEGTFEDCFNYCKGTMSTLTITLQKDCYLENKSFTHAGYNKITIDFNGHTIFANSTGSSQLFYVTDSTLVLKQAGDIPVVEEVVDAAGSSEYNAVDRMLTYYDSDFINGEVVTTRNTVQLSQYGGIITSGYDKIIYAANGYISVDGGAYASHNDGRFIHTVWAASTVDVSSGIFYNFGKESFEGGAILFQNGVRFNMNNSLFVGCIGSNGSAIIGWNYVQLRNINITDCYAKKSSSIQINGDIDFSDIRICHSKSDGTAGISVTSDEVIINGLRCYYNQSVENTNYISAKKSLTLSNVDIRNNISDNTSGVLIFGYGDVLVTDVNITGNKGSACVGLTGSEVLLRGTIIIKDNGDANCVLMDDVIINLSDSINKDSDIHITKTGFTESSEDAKIAYDGSGWNEDVTGIFTSDQGFYVKQSLGDVYLTVQNPADFMIRQDCVTLQFYTVLPRVARQSDTGYLVDIIDTRGKELPTNTGDIKTTNLYIDGGAVVLKDAMLPLFSDKYYTESHSFNLAECLDILSDMNYYVDEIWYPKPGINLKSINESDFTVKSYLGNEVIDAPNGTLIRVVCKPNKVQVNTNVVFYDYDITDGGYYSTAQDWQYSYNKKHSPTVKQFLDEGSIAYLHTNANGINSEDNYHNGDENTPRLSFGNANMGVKWQDSFRVVNGNNISINKFNRASTGGYNTYKGASFGLVKSLDSEGRIVYAGDISVPYLFNEGPAIGKTVYNNYQLQWDREGDMYTLCAVIGAEPYCQNLRYFVNPSPTEGIVYNNIYTNEFWPLDTAPTASGYGSDILLGKYDHSSTKRIRFNPQAYTPSSDCGHAHNYYFGMQFGFNFTVPEGYAGPLEYQFFGDDDMWVFLDGQLVCDIGGVHSAVGEFVDLWDYIERDDHEEHSLNVFFTERGGSGSTCWIRFYLPSAVPVADLFDNGSITFNKVNGDGEVLPGAEFGLYSDIDCTNILSRQSSDINGVVSFSDLKENATYFVKEISTPSLLYSLSEDVYVVKQNEFNVWVMYRLGDDSKTTVTQIINTIISMPVMPNTGSYDRLIVLLMFVLSTSAFIAALIAIKKVK